MSVHFKKIFILACLVYFLAAIFSKGYHHFDEHFQILEMANYKLGNIPFEEMPWELGHQMRPAIQPFIAYVVITVFDTLGIENPFTVAWFLRLLSACLALFVYYQLFRLYKPRFSSNKWLARAYLMTSLLLWYLIYNGVRFSSENWSALILAFAYVLYFKEGEKERKNFIIIGLLFGLAFSIRFQTALMTSGFMLWMLAVNREKVKSIFYQIIGIILGIGLGLLADWWFYEEVTISAWNYLDQNIIQNKVNNFVIRPWTFYFERFFGQGIPPISIVTTLCVLLFMLLKRKHALTWMLVPFLLVHFYIGHKELRFLFTIIPFLPFIILTVLEECQRRWKILDVLWLRKVMVFTFWINILFVLVASFRPADPYIGFYEKIYEEIDSEAKLYYIKHNPYHRITNLYFYKPEALSIEEWTSKTDVDETMPTYLVIRGKTSLPEEISSDQLIFSTFPVWLQKFNFNKWQEKSGAMKMYRLN